LMHSLLKGRNKFKTVNHSTLLGIRQVHPPDLQSVALYT